jgi:nitrous oxidase accessory protein NosD
MLLASAPVRRRREYRPGVAVLESRRLLSTFVVDDDLKQRPDAQFQSIQAAVDAAGPDDTVKVYPGTYREQVTVPAGKDGLRLLGQDPRKVTIQAPATMSGSMAIVEVDADDVTVGGFTIAGPSQGINAGVLIDNGGSATVLGNHITDIRDDPLSGRQSGFGVVVKDGSARIVANLIDQYQKGGIVVNGPGSDAEVGLNVVLGVGPTDVIGQNGIQVSEGATADVHDNYVANNIYTPQTFGSSGIILSNPGPVKVRDNVVVKNDFGVYADHVAGGVITGNQISKSTYDGIDLLNGTTGTLVANNESGKNGLDGIFVDSTSAGNTVRDNVFKNNRVYDAEDQSHGAGTSGTANTYVNNKGKTSNPPGLVQKKAARGDDDSHGEGDDGPGRAWGRARSNQAAGD